MGIIWYVGEGGCGGGLDFSGWLDGDFVGGGCEGVGDGGWGMEDG